MIDKKTGVMLAAGAAVVLVVAGAVAVAATDWGGGGETQLRPTRTASQNGNRPRSSGRGSANLYLLHFDADRDGRITRSEVEAGILAQFQAIDSNHDGRLDAAEYQVYEEARRAERKAWRAQHPEPNGEPAPERTAAWDPMKRLDWNRDGFITLEEFGGRERALAMRADRDGDGTVLADDLKRPPARRAASAQ